MRVEIGRRGDDGDGVNIVEHAEIYKAAAFDRSATPPDQ
jgi:hypothetical protein